MNDIESFRRGEPGVYDGIPAETYHELHACSASRLKAFSRSPAHCRDQILHPQAYESGAKERGSGAHACILEPAHFAAQYGVGPDVDLRTKAGKEAWTAFEMENAGKTLLRGRDGECIAGMHMAVWGHPGCARLLSSPGPNELSVVWIDGATGQLCKCRVDSLRGTIAVDIKTTTDASDDGFACEIRKWKYDLQAAFYLRGLAANDIEVDGFAFIAVESKRYHGVNLVTIDDQELAEADDIIFGDGGLLGDYSVCARDGVWPCYGKGMKVLRLPPRRRGALVEI